MTEDLEFAVPFTPSQSRLYRQYFSPAEIRMLDATPPDSALSDIQLLRILIARVLDAARRKTRLTIVHRLDMLSAFCHAAATLAALVRYEHKRLYPEGSLDPEFLAGGATDESEL